MNRNGIVRAARVEAVGPALIVIGPTSPPVHGVSVATENLLMLLRGTGRLAAHLNTRDPRPVETIGRFDVENVRLGLWHALQLVRLLRRLPHADVYLPVSQGTGGFLRDALFLAAARTARRRVYVHLNGGSFQSFYVASGPLMKTIIRLALANVHQAWVLSPSLCGAFDGVIPRNRVRVVENVVRDEFEAREMPTSVTADDGRLRLLYLANLFPTKGCFDLVDALLELGDTANGWHVRFVGSADSMVRARLHDAARALAGHGVTVELRGVRTGEEKLDELEWGDVFVFPTRYPQEGQPHVLLEALAAGLPIVSTHHAAIPETVRDGEEALLVAPGDTAELGRALVRLAQDPELRARLARNARSRYESHYRPARLERDVLDALGVHA